MMCHDVSPQALTRPRDRGNLREWVEDCWHENYARAPRDGSAWTSGDCSRRVLRSGSWVLIPVDLRSAYRDVRYAGVYSPSLGFRVSRTLD